MNEFVSRHGLTSRLCRAERAHTVYDVPRGRATMASIQRGEPFVVVECRCFDGDYGRWYMIVSNEHVCWVWAAPGEMFEVLDE